ncbi:hypothetical protein AALO_G00245900 [Alosa alosa]|uniref:Uncharacterized protein n=1 Tax=Alosa alosa TaxID=278164 RepID=A0AAV6FSA5_9TELE|nr:hypothetical protein AALO_G00245900 [Alosa alosa]
MDIRQFFLNRGRGKGTVRRDEEDEGVAATTIEGESAGGGEGGGEEGRKEGEERGERAQAGQSSTRQEEEKDRLDKAVFVAVFGAWAVHRDHIFLQCIQGTGS